MSWLSDLFPRSRQGQAQDRPVLTRNQAIEFAERIMGMTKGDTVSLAVSHTSQIVTRMAKGQVLSSDDGDELTIQLISSFGSRQQISASTNQLNEKSLRAMVESCEALARQSFGSGEELITQPQIPDASIPTALWNGPTVRAMNDMSDTVLADVFDAVAKERLVASGFLGFMARSEVAMTKEGILTYSEETDSEITVTARTEDGKASGWSGQAARDWSKINYHVVTSAAVEMAKRSVNPVALEPGRRTAILSSAAVAQLLRYLALEFTARDTNDGRTGFSRDPRGNRLGQRVFDPRINMSSDPNDPEGGYRSYFGDGFANPAMTWVEKGVLKNLAYDNLYANERGVRPYTEQPFSIRVSGGNTSTSDMIAQCSEGIYVNRLSSVEMVDLRTGLLTGVTRDGCFFIKNGKIDRPIRNFRFLDSPFFFLNNLEALGPSQRAAFGYTPASMFERRINHPYTNWPRRPIIVPSMMVRDFNFNALSEAV